MSPAIDFIIFPFARSALGCWFAFIFRTNSNRFHHISLSSSLQFIPPHKFSRSVILMNNPSSIHLYRVCEGARVCSGAWLCHIMTRRYLLESYLDRIKPYIHNIYMTIIIYTYNSLSSELIKRKRWLITMGEGKQEFCSLCGWYWCLAAMLVMLFRHLCAVVYLSILSEQNTKNRLQWRACRNKWMAVVSLLMRESKRNERAGVSRWGRQSGEKNVIFQVRCLENYPHFLILLHSSLCCRCSLLPACLHTIHSYLCTVWCERLEWRLVNVVWFNEIPQPVAIECQPCTLHPTDCHRCSGNRNNFHHQTTPSCCRAQVM